MRQQSREEIEHSNDNDGSDETTALLLRAPGQNLPVTCLQSATAQAPVSHHALTDLETGEPLPQIYHDRPDPDKASIAFQAISVTKLLCIAILMGSILTELKTESLTAPFIMSLVSAGVIGLSDAILVPVAVGISNTITDRTKKQLNNLTAADLGLWGTTFILTALTYGASNYDIGFSPEWTGWFAMAALALECMTTMYSILVLAQEQCREPMTPRFGQRGSSTHFQLNVNATLNTEPTLTEAHTLTEVNPLTQQP